MLLRSGYNTEFSCGAEIWSPNFMTPWKRGEFKKEVREMRKRLDKMKYEDCYCYKCDCYFSNDEVGGDDNTENEEWICSACYKNQEDQ